MHRYTKKRIHSSSPQEIFNGHWGWLKSSDIGLTDWYAQDSIQKDVSTQSIQGMNNYLLLSVVLGIWPRVFAYVTHVVVETLLGNLGTVAVLQIRQLRRLRKVLWLGHVASCVWKWDGNVGMLPLCTAIRLDPGWCHTGSSSKHSALGLHVLGKMIRITISCSSSKVFIVNSPNVNLDDLCT